MSEPKPTVSRKEKVSPKAAEPQTPHPSPLPTGPGRGDPAVPLRGPSANSYAARADVSNKESIRPFDLREVQLLDSMFKQRFEVNRQYLLSLDPDALLFSFRHEAALPHWSLPLDGVKLNRVSLSDHAQFVPNDPALEKAFETRHYDGWEHPTFIHRGHFMGHYLSACASVYAAVKDADLKRRADYVIEELGKCQQSNGNGYIGPIPERYLDTIERGSPYDLDRDQVIKKGLVFPLFIVPYYVLHKVLLGLLDNYKIVGNVQALHILTRMADYIGARVARLTAPQMQRVLHIEFGGMPELLWDLYAETGEPRYEELARRFEYAPVLEPLARNQDCITDYHANATLPKIHGAARAYEITGDTRYRDIAVNFWNIVAATRTYATGGSTVEEYWKEANQLKDTLSTQANQETCSSYNWMRLTNYLLTWTADSKYADMVERVLVNSILGAQDPESGMFTYYSPLKAPGKKGGPFLDGKFGTPTGSFWCCYGTGIQAFASFAGSIYHNGGDTLYVNQFIPSEVRWSCNGAVVRVCQEGRYPVEPKTRITVHTLSGSPLFTLRVRIPWWTRGARVVLNGQEELEATAADGYCDIARNWKDGDVLEVSLPMSLYTQAINDDARTVAFLYGPLVLAGLTDTDRTLRVDLHQLEECILPDPNHPLRFRLRQGRDEIPLVPLYEVTDARYGVYFPIAES